MAPKDSADPEYVALQKEIESLRSRITASQKAVRDAELDQVALSTPEASKLKLQTKRNLKGHIHKVNGVAFAGDSRHLVSGSLDGKLIIWDTWSGNKVQIIPLRSSWVMTVAYSPSGNYIASGGMDNMCTIHDLNNRNTNGEAKVLRELAGYDGFLSCVKFLNDKQLVTGSGDMKISRWDVETGKRSLELFGHAGDVVAVSVHPTDENLLITGSVDRTAKLWDLRLPAAQQTFYGHEADVNAVFYHPSTLAFATASEDFTARIFDIRADQEISLNKASGSEIGFTSTVLSKSGRYIVAGGDDGAAHVWDSLKSVYLGTLSGHEDRITSLAITENGMAIASASWDQSVRLWL